MFNTGTLDLNGTNEGIQSLFGDTGTVTNNHATTASTLTLGTNNGSSLFGGTIVNGLSTLALTKANAGGAVLTGVNTYTGATNITGGFVQLGNGGITGGIAAASNVVTGANTQLVFNRMDSFPIANAISGAGAVVQNGMSGTVSLTGATTTYSGGTIINSATLSAGNGGTAGTFGAGNITVAAGANAQSNRSNNWTLANPIGGQGNFIQAGTCVTTATALNTYTGTTTVNAGTLEVGGTGALTGTTQVTINTGGTLLLTSTAADRVNDAAPVTLAGGTLNTGGLNETMGALTMTGNSIIDFGAGTSLLTSASAAGSSWTGTLSIWNWTGIPVTGGGTDQLLLTSAAANGNITFSNINFFSGAGTGQIGFGSAFVPNGFGGGEIVPVPEPSSVATVMGLLGLIGWRERRKAAHARQAARSAK